MLRSITSLLLIAGACAGVLIATQLLTGNRIDANVRERELQLIVELAGTLPPASSTWAGDVWDLCNGAVLVRTEANGYGGPVALLVSIAADSEQPRLRGLRITRHQETPGLADFIQHPERGWLQQLKGRSQTEMGSVDSVSGATITSRAVQRAVLQAFAEVPDRPQPGCSA